MNSFNLLIYNLMFLIILTLISSINIYFLLISILIYLIILIKYKCLNKYNSSLIFVLSHFLIFTLSYAEILPWEIFIVFILFILIIYYQIKLNKKFHLN